MLLDACVAHLAQKDILHEYAGPALRGFLKLRQTLTGCAASGPDLDALWREAVAVGHYAAHLAEELELDARTAAAAGLMHRVGEILLLAALAEIEEEQGVRFDAPLRADICTEHAARQAARLLGAWRFSAPVAVAAASWRRAPMQGKPYTEATAVYVGHLLAAGRLEEPALVAPGVASAITGVFGIPQAALDKVLSADDALRSLLERVG